MDFQEKRGIGYCGLACVLCSYVDCPGCAAKIASGGDCSAGKCAITKNLDGCYACKDYGSCTEGMPHGKRSQAFLRYAKEFGKQALIDRLRINFENGITYHRPDKLSGDYDRCDTELEICDLLKNGKSDPYDICPKYESEKFFLRLVSMDDAQDLLGCYGDIDVQKLFNNDNCSDWLFSGTIDKMREWINGWLKEYKERRYVRFSVVDKQKNKAVGTIEIFDGNDRKYIANRKGHSVLRIDIMSIYENEEYLSELLKVSDSFFYDFKCEKIVIKTHPEAMCRINALKQNGYLPYPPNSEWVRENYYMKESSENELDIRRLIPELLDDYLNFFDNVAFTDHLDWSQCYCIHFHWQSKWDDEPPRNNRDRVIEHIDNGTIQGYLTYSNGKVVGWCNTNDKNNYAALKYNVDPELWTDDEDTKVKSVVCFLVAPDMRGKGIATKMLERICTDADAGGYDFIEGYPPTGESDMYAAHHGTIAFFEKCGFGIHKQNGNGCIMRKYLENKRG